MQNISFQFPCFSCIPNEVKLVKRIEYVYHSVIHVHSHFVDIPIFLRYPETTWNKTNTQHSHSVRTSSFISFYYVMSIFTGTKLHLSKAEPLATKNSLLTIIFFPLGQFQWVSVGFDDEREPYWNGWSSDIYWFSCLVAWESESDE